MRIAYKALVNRFNIPRPTLIEWQKRLEDDPKNWRSTHLKYLREQLIIEEETIEEIAGKGILFEEYFLLSVFLFFQDSKKTFGKKEFILALRKFSITIDSSVEFQHPFSKRIWINHELEGQKIRMAPYPSVVMLLEQLTSAQYYCLMQALEHIVSDIKVKLSLDKPKFINSTWQDLHMFDKVFSKEALTKRLVKKGLLSE